MLPTRTEFDLMCQIVSGLTGWTSWPQEYPRFLMDKSAHGGVEEP